MRWVGNSQQHAYMKTRREQNLSISEQSAAEKWAAEHLRRAKVGNWHRQHPYGVRIFDFWHAKRGIAVEIDGDEHCAEYDQVRDSFAFLRSGIIVLRVRNFDESGMAEAISHIQNIGLVKERRKRMGGNQARKALTAQAGLSAHTDWEPPSDVELSARRGHKIVWA